MDNSHNQYISISEDEMRFEPAWEQDLQSFELRVTFR